MEDKMNFLEKISNVQKELKAPKGQYNKFGNYNFRNCEDIVEAVKPILSKYKLVLNINDDIVLIGDRFYIKATATIYDIESENKMSTTAFAREPLEKKGMDESQLTGASSSYARKYALNGLFAIDDTKDADSNSYTQLQQPKKELNPNLVNELNSLGVTLEMVASYLSKDVSELVDMEIENVINKTKERRKNANV